MNDGREPLQNVLFAIGRGGREAYPKGGLICVRWPDVVLVHDSVLHTWLFLCTPPMPPTQHLFPNVEIETIVDLSKD